MKNYKVVPLMDVGFANPFIIDINKPNQTWVKLDYVASVHIGKIPNGLYAIEDKILPVGMGHLCARLGDGIIDKLPLDTLVFIPHKEEKPK